MVTIDRWVLVWALKIAVADIEDIFHGPPPMSDDSGEELELRAHL